MPGASSLHLSCSFSIEPITEANDTIVVIELLVYPRGPPLLKFLSRGPIKVKSERISLGRSSRGTFELPDVSRAHASSCQIFVRLRIPQKKDIKGPSTCAFRGLPAAAGEESKSDQALSINTRGRTIKAQLSLTVVQGLIAPLLRANLSSSDFNHRPNPRGARIPSAPSAASEERDRGLHEDRGSSSTVVFVPSRQLTHHTINESISEFPCTPSSIQIRSDVDVDGGSMLLDLQHQSIVEKEDSKSLLPPELPTPAGHLRTNSKSRIASEASNVDHPRGSRSKQEASGPDGLPQGFSVHHNGSFSNSNKNSEGANASASLAPPLSIVTSKPPRHSGNSLLVEQSADSRASGGSSKKQGASVLSGIFRTPSGRFSSTVSPLPPSSEASNHHQPHQPHTAASLPPKPPHLIRRSGGSVVEGSDNRQTGDPKAPPIKGGKHKHSISLGMASFFWGSWGSTNLDLELSEAKQAASALCSPAENPPSAPEPPPAALSEELKEKIRDMIKSIEASSSLDPALHGSENPFLQSASQHLKSIDHGLTPRRAEYKATLEALLDEKAEDPMDEAMARAVLESVAQQVTPFDRGVLMGGEGSYWYRLDLQLREEEDPRANGGIRKEDDQASVKQGDDAKTGSENEEDEKAEEKDEGGEGQGLEPKKEVGRVGTVPVRALYAPIDQCSAGGDHACACIALEVVSHWIGRMAASALFPSETPSASQTLMGGSMAMERSDGPGPPLPPPSSPRTFHQNMVEWIWLLNRMMAPEDLADLVRRGCDAWKEQSGASSSGQGGGEGEGRSSTAQGQDTMLAFHAALDCRNSRWQRRRDFLTKMEREKSKGAIARGSRGSEGIGRNSLTLTVPSPPSASSLSPPTGAPPPHSQGKLWEVAAAYSQVGPLGLKDQGTTFPLFARAAARAAREAREPLAFLLVAAEHCTAALFLPGTGTGVPDGEREEGEEGEGGIVVFANSLGRSLAPSCRNAHVLVFDGGVGCNEPVHSIDEERSMVDASRGLEDFISAYVGLVKPAFRGGVEEAEGARPEPIQVAAHRVSFSPPEGGEPSFDIFSME